MDIMGATKLGKRIQDLRSERNMTQADLAARVGVSPQSVSRWERGEDVPQLAALVRLAAVFGLPVQFLTEEPPAESRTPGDQPWQSSLWRTSREAARRLAQLEAIAARTKMTGMEWNSVAALFDMLERQLGLEVLHGRKRAGR